MSKLTEQQIQEALKTDPAAIAFRERIEKMRALLGEDYVKDLEKEYQKYIRKTYKT